MTGLEELASEYYAAYIEHLSHCPLNHLDASCAEGTRLRRKWKRNQSESLRGSPQSRPFPGPEGSAPWTPSTG
ncbi:hypothetical protein GCM10010349_48080 [Streptomyces flavofungini]|nr:hypothetical protein GCM10010349_48080 [Streptomyces flavofungini]